MFLYIYTYTHTYINIYIYIYTYVCLNSTRPLTLSMVYPQNNTCRMLRKKFVNLKLEASNLKLFECSPESSTLICKRKQ